jgi:hypothetical protein
LDQLLATVQFRIFQSLPTKPEELRSMSGPEREEVTEQRKLHNEVHNLHCSQKGLSNQGG